MQSDYYRWFFIITLPHLIIWSINICNAEWHVMLNARVDKTLLQSIGEVLLKANADIELLVLFRDYIKMLCCCYLVPELTWFFHMYLGYLKN